MRFYHFKEQGDLDAHIFAATPERGAELFLIYLLSAGAQPEEFMWAELRPEHFDEPQRSRLRETLALEQEGVASFDDERGWVPVPPLVRMRPEQDPGDG